MPMFVTAAAVPNPSQFLLYVGVWIGTAGMVRFVFERFPCAVLFLVPTQ